MNKRTQNQTSQHALHEMHAGSHALNARQESTAYLQKPVRPWVRNVAKTLIALLLFESTIVVSPAYGQNVAANLPITPSGSAPAGQRPLMDAANNGVPIVLIAPPSAAGVSRNQYEQFNVNPNGLILNNSGGHTQTQLGGWIAGNPQLGVTPARIILNEVVSGNPSHLRGTIEVAGRRADIVVANPNGITCNGCGFLNTGRASLTTGAPQFGADGSLSGFNVRQGQLTVGGDGLNAANLEQLDLIARGLVIEGEIWAKNLNVIAGANQVLYGTLQATTQTGQGTAPGFAIDIKDVGGMYANQIYLVATEQGLGVNSTGRTAALQGNLVLSANGDLSLQDTYARQDIRIAGTGNLLLNGQTLSDGATDVSAAGVVKNRGAIDAHGSMTLAAGAIDNTGTIAQRDASGVTLTAAGQFSNSGVLFSTGSLGVSAGNFVDAGGQLLSTGDLSLHAGQISLAGTRMMTDGNARINAVAGLNAQGADIRAETDIVVKSGSGIASTDSTWQAARDISLTAASVTNRRAALLANGRLDITTTDTIDNTDGKLLAAGNVRLSGLSLINNRGQVITDANGTVSLDGALQNAGGLISAKGNLALNTGNGLMANTAGIIIADGGMEIFSGDLSNVDGVINARARQNQVLSIQAANVTNHRGVIDAAAALQLNTTAAIDNTGGVLQSGTGVATANGSTRIASASIANNGGRIIARDVLTANTATLNNNKTGASQGVIASTLSSVNVTAAALTNAGGLITAAGDTTIRSTTLDNTAGELSSGTKLDINTGTHALTNDGGSLLAGADVAIKSGIFRNNLSAGGQAARIAASNDVVINTADFSNDGSSIRAGRDIRIGTGNGLLSNQGGALEAQRALGINAGVIDTHAGRIISNGDLSIQAASVQATDARIAAVGALSINSAEAVVNVRGVIASDNTIGINAVSLDNTDGTVSGGTNADIRLGSSLLDNTRGRVTGVQALALQSGEIRNLQGVIASGSGLVINTQNRVLDNTGGQIVAAGDLRIDSAHFGNDGGTAASIGGKLAVDTHGNELSSNSGKLQAQGDVTLASGGFSNRSGMLSGANITTQIGATDNSAGQIIAAGNLVVTSQALTNQSGLLQAVGNVAIDTQGLALNNATSGPTGGIISGGALAIRAGSLDNKAGYVASNGSQSIIVVGDIDNRATGGNAGQIVSNAGTSISAGNLLNSGGLLSTLGNVSVNTNLLDNRAGRVAASGDATFTAVTVDNSIADGVGGTIDAGTLSITGATANNNGGALRSAGDSIVNVTSFANSGGTASAKKALSVVATSLDNAGGSLIGDMSVTITTSSGSIGGTIASANDVTLNINGNYSNSGLLSAQRNLTVNAANIANSGTLKAGDTLTANTGDLANSGEISAHTTNLNVSGTLTNTSTGLIDGVNTNINAGITDNAGRIYGDVLRIKGNTVNNRATGTIAARNTLLIGAQQVNNTNGALIYSLGNIAMAGDVDASGNVVGQMQQLLNASSRIEAAGNIDMAVANLTNRNDALTTRIATSVESINKTYIQPEGSVTKYDASVLGWDPSYKENSGRYVLPSTTYPFAQYGAVPMLHSNEPYCIDWGSEFSSPCTVVHNYAASHPIWALFNVAPPNFSDLTAPVLPADQVPYGACLSYNTLTEMTSRSTDGGCGAYWIAKDIYDQTVAQRITDAESQLDSRITIFNSDVSSRGFEVWNEYQITSRSTSETVIDSTSPAQILAGGAITITGSGTKLNDNSQIIAGGAINIGGTSVINQAAEGTRSTTESGQVRYRRIEHSGGFCDCYKIQLFPWSPTTGAPIVETFQLPGYSYTPYAGNQTATRNLSVLTGTPSTASAAANLAAIGQNRNMAASTLNAVLPSSTTVPTAANAPLTIVRVNAIGSGTQARDVILSTLPRLIAPSNSLFTIHPQPNARFLVETDPRFTNYRAFLSSDYMLQALNRDPERQLKRYGDGFYEQQLVNDQILALTGRRFLTGYTDTQSEYRALMHAGVAFAQQFQLSPGVSLSAEQMALLTTDIVWLTEQTVTLADGQTQQVLVPQVYLRRPRDGDLQQSGSLIAGSDIRITTETDLVNSGTIAADRSSTLLAGGDLLNEGGRISGQDIVARASNDLKNLSGIIQGVGANSNVSLLAGRDIVLQTRTIATSTQTSATTAASSRVSVDRIATVQGGNVRLDAGRDLVGKGSDVQAQRELIAAAGRDIKVSAVAGSYQVDIQRGGNTNGRAAYIKEESTTNQVATLAAGENVTLTAGLAGTGDVNLKGVDVAAGNNVLVQGTNVTIESVRDRQLVDVQNVRRNAYNRTMRDDESLAGGNVIAGNSLAVIATGAPTVSMNDSGDTASKPTSGNIIITGAALSAQAGQLALAANNDVVIQSAFTRNDTIDESYSNNSNRFRTITTTESASSTSSRAEGSQLIGNTVAVISGNDITVQGSSLTAIQGIGLDAARDITITSAQETSSASYSFEKKRSGFSGSVMGGISHGKSAYDESQGVQSITQAGSNVSGTNVSINSGRDATITASTVLADQNIDVLAGRNINVLAAAQGEMTQSESHSTSNSIGIASGMSGRFTIYGKNAAEQNGKTTNTQQSTSVLSANNGNLSMHAGLDSQTSGTGEGNITTQGADLLAQQKITLSGNAIDLQAIHDASTTQSASKTKSVTVGAALTGSIGSKITAITDMIEQAQHTDNDRLKGALALKAGYDAYKLAGSGAMKTSLADIGTKEKPGDPSGAAFGVSVSIGTSKSEQKSATEDTRARGTSLQAGSIDIAAVESDIRMSAAKLQAQDISLEAARNIELTAAASTADIQSSNKSSNAAIGVTFGIGQQSGISFQLSAGQAKGATTGKETTFDNTQITATDTLTVKSGADTTLQGAQLAANRVNADIGGDLTIQTLQDTSSFDSKQSSSGFSLSLCIPPFCIGVPVSGSVNVAKQSIHHNYQSTTGQSGIAAGEGGFDINVAGNTALHGAAITSKAEQERNSLQTASLTSTDLDNQQNTKAKSSSIGLAYGGGTAMATMAANVGSNVLGNLGGAANLPKNGSEQSQTLSVISPANITITGTGNAARDEQSAQAVALLTSRDAATADGSLTNTLTLQQAQALQEDQRKNAENQQAANLVGAVMTNMIGDLAAKQQWKDGSPEKMALHGLAGLVQAKIGGTSVGAGIAAGIAHEAMVPVLEGYLYSLGFDQSTPAKRDEFNALMQAGAVLVGAAAGAVAGGNVQGAASGASISMVADTNNRMLHPKEIIRVDQKAREFAKQINGGREPTEAELAYARQLLFGIAQGRADKELGDHTPIEQMKPDQVAALKFYSKMAKENDTFVDDSGNTRRYFENKQIRNPADPLITNEYQTTSVFLNEVAKDKASRDYYWHNQGINIPPSSGTAEEQAVYKQRETERIKTEGFHFVMNNGVLLLVRGAAKLSARGGTGASLPSKPGSATQVNAGRTTVGDEPYSPDGLSNGNINHPVGANGIPKSPVDIAHAIGADYTKAGRPTGGHSLLNGDVKIVPGTESVPDASGVYKATIQVPDPRNPGQWLTKTSNNSTNSMFPKNWDAARIQSEVDAAWNSPNKVVNGRKWSSFTPSGVKVEGFISPRTTVFPVHQP